MAGGGFYGAFNVGSVIHGRWWKKLSWHDGLRGGVALTAARLHLHCSGWGSPCIGANLFGSPVVITGLFSAGLSLMWPSIQRCHCGFPQEAEESPAGVFSFPTESPSERRYLLTLSSRVQCVVSAPAPTLWRVHTHSCSVTKQHAPAQGARQDIRNAWIFLSNQSSPSTTGGTKQTFSWESVIGPWPGQWPMGWKPSCVFYSLLYKVSGAAAALPWILWVWLMLSNTGAMLPCSHTVKLTLVWARSSISPSVRPTLRRNSHYQLLLKSLGLLVKNTERENPSINTFPCLLDVLWHHWHPLDTPPRSLATVPGSWC